VKNEPENKKKIIRLQGFDSAFLNEGFVPNVTIEIIDSVVSKVTKTGKVESGDSLPVAETDRPRTLNMKGLTALPGLIDAHAHLFSIPTSRTSSDVSGFDLSGVKSIDEMQQVLRRVCRKSRHGIWLVGAGWDQEKLKDKRFPSLEDIEIACSDHPVLLTRTCGHLGVCNSAALNKTLNEFGKQLFSNPKDGIVKEKDLHLVVASMPLLDVDSLKENLKTICKEVAKVGLTGVHTFLSKENWRNEAKAIKETCGEGGLDTRLRLYFPCELLEDEEDIDLPSFGGESPLVSVGGLKIFCDGSLGARTALLREPYDDDAGNFGCQNYTEEELIKIMKKARERGLQVSLHAIGDGAISEALHCIEVVFLEDERGKKSVPSSFRPRIEHASIFPKDLVAKARALGVVLVVQPMFAVSDTWIERRVGLERTKDAYPFRKMLIESRLRVAASSDAPHEPLNPLAGIEAFSIKRSFGLGELIPVEEAIRAYSEGASFAGFSEERIGKISPGFCADLTILTDFDFERPNSISKAKVAATFVAGKVVYSSDERFAAIYNN
jgi:predicted amidohydrolase YtcJ